MNEINRTVGVLGASGKVGKGAVEALLTEGDFSVIGGGRDTGKIKKAFNGKIPAFYVDIDDGPSLINFMERCSVIINCAGPAKKIMDRVALKALHKNVHYIDVAGDIRLYKELTKIDKDAKSKNLSFIISAGIYPGLSEVFPSYVMEEFYDEIEKLEVFYAGKGELSLNAAYDYVYSIKESYAEGMSFYSDGRTEKITSPAKSFKLPEPAGTSDIYPLMTDEFKGVCKRYNPKEAFFYNTFQERKVLEVLMNIRILEKYKTDKEMWESTEMLKNCFNDVTDDYTMFHINAEGKKDNQKICAESTISWNIDGNILTGGIASSAAMLLSDGKIKEKGVMNLSGVVNPKDLITLLERQGAKLKSEIKEFQNT